VKQMQAGFDALWSDTALFRALVTKFQDRILFATDAVVGRAPTDDAAGMARVIAAYRDVLEEDEYQPGLWPEHLRHGLHLDAGVLRKIECTNFDTFIARPAAATAK
jgi:hypothetical protein